MKKSASLLLVAVAAFAFARAASAQVPDTYSETTAIRRPTPSASATPAASSGTLEASLSEDDKGKTVTTTFPAATTTIYLVTKNVSGAKGDKVEAVWYTDDAGKALPAGKKLYTSAVQLPDTKSYNPTLHVTGPIKGAFPPGKYHVVLSVGSKAVKTLKFTVK